MTVTTLGEQRERRAPKVFVSYAWESEEHKSWVRNLASSLRTDGIDVTLDQWHLQPGDLLPQFMESAVRENHFVLIICTQTYREKSDSRLGGVGYEGDIMTGEVYTVHNQRKFVPLLRRGSWADAAPSWLRGKYYLDFRKDPYSEEEYQRLLRTLHGVAPRVPPLGARPDFGESLNRPDISVAVDVQQVKYGIEVRLKNLGAATIDDCSLILKNLDKWSAIQGAFLREPFHPIVILPKTRVGAQASSDGAYLVFLNTEDRTELLVESHRPGRQPEFLTEEGTWRAELLIEVGSEALSSTSISFRWKPGGDPLLVPMPPAVGSRISQGL